MPYKLKTLTLLLLSALSLTGCGTMGEFHRPFEEARAVKPDDKHPDVLGESEVDMGVTYEASDAFVVRRNATTGKLPNYFVQDLNVVEGGAVDALQLLGDAAGLSVTIQGGAQTLERYGAVSMSHLRGSLEEVLDDMSETLGFFWAVKKRTLVISMDDQFVMSLPPILGEDSMAGIANTVQLLGAKDVTLDRNNRMLVFRANRPALDKIESYMSEVRQGQALIVYDLSVYQVDLKDDATMGVNWNALQFQSSTGGLPNSVGTAVGTAATGTTSTTSTSTSASTATSAAAAKALPSIMGVATKSAFGLGMVLSGSKFNLDTLVNFMKTQGTVKTVTNPRLAAMSGTRAHLRVGKTTPMATNITPGIATTGGAATIPTVQWNQVKTGVEINLYGDYYDGTVTTKLVMGISDIVATATVAVAGSTSSAPATADRELDTVIKVRPGDTMLLGGILVNTDSIDSSSGLGQVGKVASRGKSELVLALKPRVIRFKAAAPAAAKARLQVQDSAPFNNNVLPTVSKPVTVTTPAPQASAPQASAAAPAKSQAPKVAAAPVVLAKTAVPRAEASQLQSQARPEAPKAATPAAAPASAPAKKPVESAGK